MKKIELIIPEVKKQEEVSDQLSENEYSFRQKQWDSPIIPSTKVAPELIELLKNYQAPSFELPHSTSVTEAAEFYYQEYAKLFRQNDQLN